MQIEPRIPLASADVSRGKVSARTWWCEVLIFVALLTLLYFALGWIGESLAARCPDGWEAKFQSAGWVEATTTEPTLAERHVREIFAKVLEAAHSTRTLPYQLYFAQAGNGPNAFAVPGGGIVVTPEAMDLVTSEEGMAFILAHELGHHEHRDVLRRVGRKLILSLAIGLVSQSSGNRVLASSVSFGELAFSRDQERKADLYAVAVIQHLYGNSDKALEFFEKMAESHPHELPAMFSSHPSTRERIESLRAVMQSTPAKP